MAEDQATSVAYEGPPTTTEVTATRIRGLWPEETVRLVRKLQGIAPRGIFSTGIENSDPWISDVRRDQLREAHDFRRHWAQRLQTIKDLGLDWVRFGEGYSFAHPAPDTFDFDLTDRVVRHCDEIGLHFIADFLHFGLPEWLHAATPNTPFFQNPRFPEGFAHYAAAFTRRYPTVRYFTIVNEPYFTARASAKDGSWNEHIVAPGHDDRAFVRAVANIARAAILAREAIECIWHEERRPDEPIFFQNDSLQKAYAARGSGRAAEAARFNIRCYAALDLIFGQADDAMRDYLISQGLPAADYDWFMRHGTKRGTVLGVDYYPGNIRVLERGTTLKRGPERPYYLYKITAEYWRRYRMPLLHMEINAPPQHALDICRKTYDAVRRLRADGYPMLGMAWFGDDHQVGWQCDLVGSDSQSEYHVGLSYKGVPEPVAHRFSHYARRGLAPMQI